MFDINITSAGDNSGRGRRKEAFYDFKITEENGLYKAEIRTGEECWDMDKQPDTISRYYIHPDGTIEEIF